jgi:small multidrug resistance pump
MTPAGLLLATASEVVGTSSLKLPAGMTRPLPTAVVLLAYDLAVVLLAKAVQLIPPAWAVPSGAASASSPS